jgi:hypothetical protein
MDKDKAYKSRFFSEPRYAPARERLYHARQYNDGRGFMFKVAAEEALDIANSTRREFPQAPYRNDNYYVAKANFKKANNYYQKRKSGENAPGSVVEQVMPSQSVVQSVLPEPENEDGEPLTIEELDSAGKELSEMFFNARGLLNEIYNELKIKFDRNELDPIDLASSTFEYAVAANLNLKTIKKSLEDGIDRLQDFIVRLEKKDHTIEDQHEKITSEVEHLKIYVEEIERDSPFFIQHYSKLNRRGGKRTRKQKKMSKYTKKHRR